MKKFRILLGILMLLTITSLSGCGAKENSNKTEVKIAYLPITHALPVFEEKEKLESNENSDIKIKLVKYGSWPELLDALNSGQVDGASVLIELAMKAKEQGIGIKAVALGHKDGNAIVVANNINSATDLKGKTFAIPHRLSSHNILLHDMLEKNNMSITDINIVELAPAEMPSALAGGQISGYIVAEPFGAKSVYLKTGKVLYQSNELWEDSLCCGLVLTDQFINKNKAVANEMIANYMEAGDDLNQEKAKEIAVKYLGQEKEVLDLSLQWISYEDLKITESIYTSLTEKMIKYGITETTPSYQDFIYQE